MADVHDFFAEAEARQRRLLERLAVAPVVELAGVVGANGPGGSQGAREKLWTLSFHFEAWRIIGSALQTKPLALLRKVTDEELHRWQSLIQPYGVFRVKARVESSDALLEAFVGPDPADRELQDYSTRLQKPVTFEHPPFGTFTLDCRVDFFTAAVSWGNRPISLNLSGKESQDVEAALNVAHSLWRSQGDWNRRVREYAVEKLLPLKNEAWLDEDENELSPNEFQQRMTLTAITVYPDGSFDFWHNDGGLFLGHSIQISGTLSEGPTNADIPG